MVYNSITLLILMDSQTILLYFVLFKIKDNKVGRGSSNYPPETVPSYLPNSGVGQ